MKLARSKLAEVIALKMSNSKDSTRLAREIAAYLITTRRLNDLDSLLRDVIDYRDKHGLTELTITSVNKLASQIKQDLINLSVPNNKQQRLIVNEDQDPTLIGGVRVAIAADRVLDLSIKGKVNQFKQLVI